MADSYRNMLTKVYKKVFKTLYAHTSDTGTFVKWDDASDTSTAVDIKTKDIDFGQPGQTKRIYKFYVKSCINHRYNRARWFVFSRITLVKKLHCTRNCKKSCFRR